MGHQQSEDGGQLGSGGLDGSPAGSGISPRRSGQGAGWTARMDGGGRWWASTRNLTAKNSDVQPDRWGWASLPCGVSSRGVGDNADASRINLNEGRTAEPPAVCCARSGGSGSSGVGLVRAGLGLRF